MRIVSTMPTPGQRFGRLTVIQHHSGKGLSYSKFKCQCDCGNIKIASARGLNQGTQSCGCLRKERAAAATLKDLTGQRFNRWTVLGIDPEPHPSAGAYWICQCDCGAVKSVKSYSLTGGASKSCGCFHKEQVAKSSSQCKRTHGETGTRLYNIWAGIKARCCSPTEPAYRNYGGRGIEMHEDWAQSYEMFRDWALENGYADDLTIERIEVNGNYEPGNCTFITKAEQAANKRTTVWLEAWGEKKRIKEWLDDLRCEIKNESTLRGRLVRGWAVEDAISMPLIKTRSFANHH